ncbi:MULTISPECIES: MmgE/PrpD family protein [Streptomyces]|uniref:MmgE/PrpD family protein n=2 Tax=Streptomyces TaxID=1883 RepID=A0ABV9J7F4_9ACTN
MGIEKEMASWGVRTRYEDLPDEVTELMKTLTWVIAGCTVAGGSADGCEEVVDLVRSWGGAEEATVLVHGGRVPAHAAVLANSTMARAHDICDFVMPGQHLGTSLVPVALAVTELVGGRSGAEVLTALAVGAEIGTRLGLVTRHGGFDPSGVGTVIAATVVAGRLMALDDEQMLNAMALAFNRAGGSFQSNIDASLAVRLIQGFSSRNAVECAQLALRGMTGPKHWITGVWGFHHLFSDRRDDATLAGQLGERWTVMTMGFKNFPACGGTGTATDAALALAERHSLKAGDVESVTVRMAGELPYLLVGSTFEPGRNPTVDGQFSVQYTVANALLRGTPTMDDFTPEAVTDPAVVALAGAVRVVYEPELAEGVHLGRAAVDVRTTQGRLLSEVRDGMKGGQNDPLDRDRLLHDFWDRSSHGGRPVSVDRLNRFVRLVDRMGDLDDARELVPLLLAADTTAGDERELQSLHRT